MQTKLKAGQNPDELPDSYVIFITENDFRKQNRPIYRFLRIDDETNEIFQDGSHIIYVNGAYKNDETRIGQLMHDFRCVEAEDMHNKVLADKVRYFKETEGGREEMCKVMEDMRNEAVSNERSRLIAKMVKKGDSIEAIAEFFDIYIDEVKELINKKLKAMTFKS